MGYPSGQREQTVNLPAYAFEGSNPSPTIWEDKYGEKEARNEVDDGRLSAGVAQLVERKPSKLDVAGSSPVSRSGANEVRRENGNGEMRPVEVALA